MDNQPIKRLYRSHTDRMLLGVCGGLGEYFGIDSLVFRALFLLLSFGGGAGVLIYLLLAILIPVDPSEHHGHLHHLDQREKINQFAQEIKTGAQNLANEFKSHTHSHNRGRLAGLVIVLVGSFLLLNTLFPQAVRQVWLPWNLFWPVALILVGLFIFAKRS